ncbi:MAG TPA: hypothetical protein VFA43_02800 [Gemmatimonadaceae bacterium]|nr:hypothetical protein [Gemmatimonadaceae bacterium]
MCIVSFSWACDGSNRTTGPTAALQKSVNASGTSRLVNMHDACDSATFNAAVGPGTCDRPGGVPFPEFVAQLTAHQSAGAWHNAPARMSAKVGDVLIGVNRGGETHTFTKVAAFGGGIVPFLNALAGTPNVAPECTTLAPPEFLAPGGADREDPLTAGTTLFQCCIHPWMRTTVHAGS